MRKQSDFHLPAFSSAANPSQFQEGDRVILPDGRHGTIATRDPETHHWKIKVKKQYLFETVSDFDLRQANQRGT